MLSSTDILASTLVSWNVRTMPLRASVYDGSPLAGSPSNTTRAGVGLVEAGEQVEERRLAGAVGSDQRRDRAPLHLEVVDGRRPGCRRTCGVTLVGDEDRVGLGHAGRRLDAGERVGGRVVPRLRRAAPPHRRRRRSGRTRRVSGHLRASMAISRLSPKMPCGRNTSSSIRQQADEHEAHLADLHAVHDAVGDVLLADEPGAACCR